MLLWFSVPKPDADNRKIRNIHQSNHPSFDRSRDNDNNDVWMLDKATINNMSYESIKKSQSIK